MVDHEETPPEEKKKVSVDKPRIVYRGGWGALRPLDKAPALSHPVTKILFTYTGTKECTTPDECTKIVQDLQKRDMYERGMPDIQYNFLVGGDFNVYEGRGWQSCATKDPKFAEIGENSIDIAYIGDFSSGKEPSEDLTLAGQAIFHQGYTKQFITANLDITLSWKKEAEAANYSLTLTFAN